tara:strand:+ start:58 stop:441 length:384 start_codon:yes stop_codon:yes gene_type:complete
MARTKKRKHDRYTLSFKEQAVKLANHPNVMAKDVAEVLGIHQMMLYRWRMEHNRGELRENQSMKPPEDKSPKRKSNKRKKPDPFAAPEAEITKANKRIKELEKALANREEEIDILKKARRFFEKNNK